MTEAKHTPTPWRISPYGCGFEIESEQDLIIAQVQQVKPLSNETALLERHANAAYIVRAVNSHAALVNALGATLSYRLRKPVPFADHECDWCNECVDRMNQMQRAALALARGEQVVNHA